MTATFPQLLQQHARQRPQAPALREKEFGIWQTWTWREAEQSVRRMACGLAALGLQRGHNLAFISDNRPHVYLGFLAVQAVGGVPIPLYQDAVAAEMRFVIEDAGVQMAFAENQEQVDKLLEVRESNPANYEAWFKAIRTYLPSTRLPQDPQILGSATARRFKVLE